MATTLDRTKYNLLVDDDGSGNTGSVWDKLDVSDILDAVDGLVAANVTFGGTVTEQNRSLPMGYWANVAFAANNFGVSAGTLTVDASDQNIFRYTVIGKTMFLALRLDTVSLSANAVNLTVKIPASATAAYAVQGLGHMFDNSTSVLSTIAWTGAAGGATLTLFRLDGNPFQASANNSYVRLNCQFEIQ